MSTSGGVPVVVTTQQVSQDVSIITLFSPLTHKYFWFFIYPDELFDIVGDNLYFSIQSKPPGHLLTTLSLSTLTQGSTIDTGAVFQGAIEFDVTGRKTYVCNRAMADTAGSYTIDR